MLCHGLQQLLPVGEDGQHFSVSLQLLELTLGSILALLPLSLILLLLIQVLDTCHPILSALTCVLMVDAHSGAVNEFITLSHGLEVLAGMPQHCYSLYFQPFPLYGNNHVTMMLAKEN